MANTLDLETRQRLNDLAKHELKHRMLSDIAADIQICKLEGWDYKEYLRDLRKEIDHFLGE